MRAHKNIKTLVEVILTSTTAVECCKKLDITFQTLKDAIKDVLGLEGSIDEVKEALIATAKENPDSEMANVIRIIDPSILPQKVEQAPQKYPECGYLMRTSGGSINPNIKPGIPFIAQQNYLRSKGRL